MNVANDQTGRAKKKLKFVDNPGKPHNVLREDAILECRSGENAGKIRVIRGFLDERRGDKVDIGEVTRVYVFGHTSSGYHYLDPGTSVTYNENEGTISYSSNWTKYTIRAVQDSDVLF